MLVAQLLVSSVQQRTGMGGFALDTLDEQIPGVFVASKCIYEGSWNYPRSSQNYSRFSKNYPVYA